MCRSRTPTAYMHGHCSILEPASASVQPCLGIMTLGVVVGLNAYRPRRGLLHPVATGVRRVPQGQERGGWGQGDRHQGRRHGARAAAAPAAGAHRVLLRHRHLGSRQHDLHVAPGGPSMLPLKRVLPDVRRPHWLPLMPTGNFSNFGEDNFALIKVDTIWSRQSEWLCFAGSVGPWQCVCGLRGLPGQHEEAWRVVPGDAVHGDEGDAGGLHYHH